MEREQQGGGGAGADETARVAALEARTEARVAEMAAELEDVLEEERASRLKGIRGR